MEQVNTKGSRNASNKCKTKGMEHVVLMSKVQRKSLQNGTQKRSQSDGKSKLRRSGAFRTPCGAEKRSGGARRTQLWGDWGAIRAIWAVILARAGRQRVPKSSTAAAKYAKKQATDVSGGVQRKLPQQSALTVRFIYPSDTYMRYINVIHGLDP